MCTIAEMVQVFRQHCSQWQHLETSAHCQGKGYTMVYSPSGVVYSSQTMWWSTWMNFSNITSTENCKFPIVTYSMICPIAMYKKESSEMIDLEFRMWFPWIIREKGMGCCVVMDGLL